MDKQIMISFVVPVYNGSPMLADLCKRLAVVGHSYGSFEIILVDDGSRDNSINTIKQLQQHFPAICLVQLSRNFGQHNATLAGIAQARGEIVITLDQDLQHPPEEIVLLVSKLNEGFDVVYGLPEKRPHNICRNITSAFSKWISRRILSTSLNGNFSSFRAIRGWVAAETVRYHSPYIYLDGVISWTTANVAGVVVKNPKSGYESQYTFIRLITHGINLVVNFSIRPLQIASVMGFISALLGLVLALYILAGKLMFNVPVQGWTSLMVALLVIGGAQIAFLGLIGEYIGRILMNSNRAPNYVVRSIQRKVSDHAE
jgi:undecaprenyl-phosphate 4-deoxy-4-formamido-L-arabinose transferase